MKVNLEKIPLEIRTIASIIDAYLVGGAVRDLLLGKEPHDYDLVTKNKPEENLRILKELGYTVYPKGIEFGVIAALVPNVGEVEIATFRKEMYRKERGRKPIVTYTDKLEEDLARRDFTINAMAIDLKTGEVIDLFGGLKDLQEGIIRFVGDTRKRIEEDPLRMVRFCRFAAKLGFKTNEHDKRIIREERKQIHRIASERITDEFRKAVSNAADFYDCLVDTGLASEIFGDFIDKMVELKHDYRKPHYGESIHRHTIDVLKCLQKYNDFTLTMAGIIHDFGKPFTYREKDGKIVFYEHEKKSFELCNKILGKKLKMISRNEKKEICWLVLNHMKPKQIKNNDKSIARFIAELRLDKIPKEWVEKLVKLAECDGEGDLSDLMKKIEIGYSVEMPKGEKYLHLPKEKRREALKGELVQKILEKFKEM